MTWFNCGRLENMPITELIDNRIFASIEQSNLNRTRCAISPQKRTNTLIPTQHDRFIYIVSYHVSCIWFRLSVY